MCATKLLVSRVPWTTTVIVPWIVFPFAVAGIRKVPVAAPPATPFDLAVRGLPAIVAAQDTWPDASGPPVSL